MNIGTIVDPESEPWSCWTEDHNSYSGGIHARMLWNTTRRHEEGKREGRRECHIQTLRSAEQAAIFCPEGSNLQLRISPYRIISLPFMQKKKENVQRELQPS